MRSGTVLSELIKYLKNENSKEKQNVENTDNIFINQFINKYNDKIIAIDNNYTKFNNKTISLKPLAIFNIFSIKMRSNHKFTWYLVEIFTIILLFYINTI